MEEIEQGDWLQGRGLRGPKRDPPLVYPLLQARRALGGSSIAQRRPAEACLRGMDPATGTLGRVGFEGDTPTPISV